MEQRYIDYSRVIAVMAQQDVLEPEMATQFCKAILPQLIAELEVLQRVADTKLSGVFAVDSAPAEQPSAECEATVCSSRWGTKTQATTPKPTKKPRKSRKRKNARHQP